jgi:hypothetical protein
VTIRLPLPMNQALRLIPATVGTHRPEGPDYLLSLGTPLRVLSPGNVREALLRRARELFEDNVSSQLQ